MKASTTYKTTWHGAAGELTLLSVPADVSMNDASYQEEYVTIVQPDELGLLWPLRLTFERDEGWWIVSDDVTEVHGEGETREAAVAAYRQAVIALHRVLSAREATLSDDLLHRLAVLRSIVPPGE